MLTKSSCKAGLTFNLPHLMQELLGIKTVLVAYNLQGYHYKNRFGQQDISISWINHWQITWKLSYTGISGDWRKKQPEDVNSEDTFWIRSPHFWCDNFHFHWLISNIIWYEKWTSAECSPLVKAGHINNPYFCRQSDLWTVEWSFCFSQKYIVKVQENWSWFL